jgi:hypothetical protein
VRTAGGETALQMSVRHGHHQLAEVLRELERTVRDSGTFGVGAPQLPVGGGRILLAHLWGGAHSPALGLGTFLRALPIQYVF